MKLVLLILMGCLLATAAATCVGMFRRDEPILGVAGLSAAIVAAFAAVPYSALQDV
jgi:apolipoprotein N-acyltransferase